MKQGKSFPVFDSLWQIAIAIGHIVCQFIESKAIKTRRRNAMKQRSTTNETKMTKTSIELDDDNDNEEKDEN